VAPGSVFRRNPFQRKGITPLDERIERIILDSGEPTIANSTEENHVPPPFPERGPVPMTFLLLAGAILLALWLVETIVFLVGYRQSNSKST